MTLRLTPIAATLAAAALPFTTAVAQDKQDTQKLPEVTIKADAAKNEMQPATSTIGGAVALRDIPQTVNVVNRAVLDSQAAISMTEALRNVPGVTISAGEGGQIGDNINLRGFSARTDMFTDGFRDRGQYVRDTFFIEAVEVLKGSSSMLFGRGSTGGVINQVSKRPGLRPVTDASVVIGTDKLIRSTIDVNRALSSNSAVRVAAVGMSAESTRDVVKTKRFGLAPSFAFGLGEPTTVTMQALIQRNEDLPDYGVPLLNFGPGTIARPIPVDRSNFYGFTDDRNDQNVFMFNVSVRHKLSATSSISNRTQYSRNKTVASPTPLSAATVIGGGTPSQLIPLTQMTAPLNTRERVVNDISLYNQTALNARFGQGVVHNIMAGIEFGRDDSDVDNFTWTNLGTITLGAPVYRAKPANAVRSPNTRVNAIVDNAAVFVNDQIDLNKQWKLVGGVRWDYLKADYQSRAVSTGVLTELDRTDKVFSKRVGLVYQPTELQSYYASFGTSFNPSAEAVTLSASTADIAPEKNRSLEVGAKLDFMEGNLNVNGAVFRVEKDGRTTDPLTSVVTLSGETRVQGFEVGVVGRVSPALQLMAGYTFLDGKVVRSNDRTGSGTVAVPYRYAQGKTLANTPEHNATMWAIYSFGGAWELGGGLIYASDRFLNNYESAMTDGYTRVDASLAYRQKNYVVRFNVQNLTDKAYYETASAGRATPVKGRSLVASLNYSF